MTEKTDFAELHFLVVEDHAFQRSTLVRALQSLGAIHVAEAADGREALAFFLDGPSAIDVVVCDLEMPNMDGMEFIRRLRETGVQTSIILTSALDKSLITSVETMTRAYGIHLLGAIEKPATPAKLSELLLQRPAVPVSRAQAPAEAVPETLIIDAIGNKLYEPFFQPKIDIATGRLVGAEALARLRKPDGFFVPPDVFVPLLESRRLIDELTWIMLERSAEACRRWQAHDGLQDMSVSVNLSLTSLSDTDLADQLTQRVAAAGLDPKHMILEITESAAMTDVAHCLENLTRLRMKGFGLSIDDYGTGYSSMQQLSRIPFSELKIDRSFVTDVALHPQRRVILASSIDMARKLGLTVVAEGVESRADWDRLKELGCTLAQGYFIAKPMPAGEFLSWAGNYRPIE